MFQTICIEGEQSTKYFYGEQKETPKSSIIPEHDSTQAH